MLDHELFALNTAISIFVRQNDDCSMVSVYLRTNHICDDDPSPSPKSPSLFPTIGLHQSYKALWTFTKSLYSYRRTILKVRHLTWRKSSWPENLNNPSIYQQNQWVVFSLPTTLSQPDAEVIGNKHIPFENIKAYKIGGLLLIDYSFHTPVHRCRNPPLISLFHLNVFMRQCSHIRRLLVSDIASR